MEEFKNYKPPSHDELFMGKVYEIARKSKDPRTKIGAILVIDGHAPLEGYNGIPKGVMDLPERLQRPEKYSWIEHGERNILNMAAKFGIKTVGGTLFTQGLPCVDCARGIINCEIKNIVLHKQWEDVSTKLTNGRTWMEHYHKSKIMFDESGVSVRFFDGVVGKIGYLDGMKFDV